MSYYTDRIPLEPRTDERQRVYYDSDNKCVVNMKIVSRLYYDPLFKVTLSAGDKPVRGWWVYRVERRYERTPVSSCTSAEIACINRLPTSTVDYVPADREPYLSDAIRRRKEDSEQTTHREDMRLRGAGTERRKDKDPPDKVVRS